MSNINPRVDIAFKKIFGVEENKDLLIGLINSIVGEEDQVTDLTLLNPYNAKNFQNDKLSILDIKARGHNNKQFNIEIQITDAGDYDRRALYYWAKLYTEQLKKGEGYKSLSKTIGIHFLNFFSVPELKKYHNVFHPTEKDTGIRYFNDFELHTIELQKFTGEVREDLSDIVAKVKNALDIWVAFLTRHDLMKVDNLPKELDTPNLRKALNVLEVMNFTDEERDSYEGHLKWLWDQDGALEKREETAREKERRKIISGIAIHMIANGKQLQEISELTGINLEEIYKIINQGDTGRDTAQVATYEQEKEAV